MTEINNEKAYLRANQSARNRYPECGYPETYDLLRPAFFEGFLVGFIDPDANFEKISKIELENKVLKEAFVYSDRPFRKLLLKNADLFECFDKDIYESEMKDEFGASDVTGARIFEFRFLKENNSKLKEENKRLREALVSISKGCPTGAKGCLCLENTAIIALGMPADQLSLEQKALSSGGDL